MRRYLTIIILSCCPILAFSQKVGLVLSGGGAKGLAHLGVLKALEENSIPVDYIVGTSMGGIMGGMYAAGYSPKEIESLVLSEQFPRWINGWPEKGYNYVYRQNLTTPGFLRLNLALDSSFNFQFHSTIASDVSLNFALTEKVAQASAIARNNFDSLYIPLRVVAADVFTQQEVILSEGSLSSAMRATQTVPFFYTPVRVDGKYLFDGGVYNNFPVDVALREFNPDVILGVNVSTRIFDEYPYDKDDELVSKSLLYLLLDKSDPSQIPDHGVFIQPNMKGFTSFDFDEAEALIDSGYQQTMRQMPEIINKVTAREPFDSLALKRKAFRDRSYPFVFDKITFMGFNNKQREYLTGVFRTSKNKSGLMTLSQIKKGYFHLVSEEYFSNVFPTIRFDTLTEYFNLQLSKRPQQNFQVEFGGVIATRDISNIFLGLNFYHFGKSLKHIQTAFQAGSFYKSGSARVRFDFPRTYYLEPRFVYNSWDYLENDDLLKEVSTPTTPTVLQRLSRTYGISIGIPVREYFKLSLDFDGINDVDRYINGDVFISTDVLDNLRLKGYKSGLVLSSNTLNRKQYASTGRSYSLSASYFHLKEHYVPGSTSVKDQPVTMEHQWFQLRGTAEQYFGSGWFRSGYIAEVLFSDQPFFQNYFGTIVNTPGFFPLQDSRTLMLENFRSFNYAAVGLRNVITLRNKLDLRLEGYVFKPFDYLRENTNQEAYISRDISTLFLSASAGLVYHGLVGPVSLSVNYYDDEENQLGVLLHVGFLLFNRHPLE